MLNLNWKSIPIHVRYLYGVIVCFIVMLIGTGALVGYYEKNAEDHAAKANAAGITVELHRSIAAKADQRAQDALLLAQTLEDQNTKLKNKLASLPIPPKPEAPPAEDTALAAQLREDGMVQAPAARQDAVLVWTWRQAALTVPAWEARYNACLDLTKGQETQIQVDKVAIDQLTQARDQWKMASDDGQVQTAQLKGQISDMVKAEKISRYQKYLLVGGALAAGYFAGKGR